MIVYLQLLHMKMIACVERSVQCCFQHWRAWHFFLYSRHKRQHWCSKTNFSTSLLRTEVALTTTTKPDYRIKKYNSVVMASSGRSTPTLSSRPNNAKCIISEQSPNFFFFSSHSSTHQTHYFTLHLTVFIRLRYWFTNTHYEAIATTPHHNNISTHTLRSCTVSSHTVHLWDHGQTFQGLATCSCRTSSTKPPLRLFPCSTLDATTQKARCYPSRLTSCEGRSQQSVVL